MKKGYKVGLPCPACSDRRYTPTNVISVNRCVKCGAIHGTCYRGEAYEFYIPLWGSGKPVQYVDLEMLGSDGVERFHGWVDSQRHIVQVG